MKHEPLCYDNGGKTADRYTIFPRGLAWGPNKVNGRFLCLGLSDAPTHPLGFSQWSEGTPGKHLGKKIRWADLPEHIRKHAEARIER